MRLKEGKATRLTLTVLAGLSVICFALVEESKVEVKHPHYKEMNAAIGLMKSGLDSLRHKRAALKLPAAPEDPFGLLGKEDTAITTDKGNQASKLISENPLMAAVIADLLKKAKVAKGDVVAIGCTGSFPGANLAAYAACEAIGAKSIVVTSLGASTWGANLPDFTWLDMEAHLAATTSIHVRSVAATLGGSKDRGLGLSPAGIAALKAAAERNHVPLLLEKTLEDQIKKRMEVYATEAQGSPIKAYINVGGGVASLGARLNALKHLKNGLNMELRNANYPVRGVAIQFGTAKPPVPVIHILEVEKLAAAYHLPTSVWGKTQEELLVEEKVLFETRYNFGITLLATILLVGLTFLLIRIDLKHLHRTRPLSPAELAVLDRSSTHVLPKPGS